MCHSNLSFIHVQCVLHGKKIKYKPRLKCSVLLGMNSVPVCGIGGVLVVSTIYS